jgi:acyl-CoA hydrolase
MVFVAVDENGKKTAVPTWEPREERDIALQKHAMRFYAARQVLDQALNELEKLMA